MMGRGTLKLCFFLVATCTVVLAFALAGEMMMRWLTPGPGGDRLKLEVVASSANTGSPPPAAVAAEKVAKTSAEGSASPAPAATTLPAKPASPFDAVAGQPPAEPAGSAPLAYAEPPLTASAPTDAVQADPGPQAAPEAAAVASVDPSEAMASPAPLAAAPESTEASDAPVLVAGAPRGSKYATFKAALNEPASPKQSGQSLRILQIGDSHTAADMFTGEVRQRLQSIYGDGGAGYLVVGKPHPGVRSEVLRMAASSGWAYAAIQKSDDASQFHLSGFNAMTEKPNETLTLSTEAPVSFDSIDIQVKHGPDSGAVELKFDNDQAVKFDLAGTKPEWWFLRATSQRNRVERLRQLSITTLDTKPVDISSVAIFNQSYGVSYSAIGFPGATVDIVNKFPDDFFTEDLQRIDPQIVVLAFGTNEGFNDDLDVSRYGEHYQRAIGRIRAALPNAEIVAIGPPNGNRLTHSCRPVSAAQANCHAGAPVAPDPAQACVWQTPPKLDRVREMQKLIAAHDRMYYWNWADVMPAECGAHVWSNATPRLMQPDHVHFTSEGYRMGAAKFAAFLMPIIEKLRLSDRVVSNN